MKTVVIVAHANLKDGSIANRIIANGVQGRENVEIRNLYERYPNFNVDVDAEQQALVDADLIVLQYPIHWYNVPGLLKEWMDQVLRYGFAYGEEGNKLHGKHLLVSVTVGGPERSYQPGGKNNFTVETFLSPMEQTASFCGMVWETPIVSYSMVYIPGVWNKKEDIEQRAEQHANHLQQRIAMSSHVEHVEGVN